MDIERMSSQAQQAKLDKNTAAELRATASGYRGQAGVLQMQAEAEAKELLSDLLQSDAAYLAILEREQAVKDDARYQDAEQAFKDVKAELGMPAIAKEKRERKAALGEEASSQLAHYLDQAQDLESQAQQLEDQAAALAPKAELAIDEIVDALAENAS